MAVSRFRAWLSPAAGNANRWAADCADFSGHLTQVLSGIKQEQSIPKTRYASPELQGDLSMKVEEHPYDYDFRERFPQLEEVFRTGLEDAVLYFSEKDSKFYTILDQSFLMEFVRAAEDEKVRNKLISVLEFESDTERQNHLDDFIKNTDQNSVS